MCDHFVAPNRAVRTKHLTLKAAMPRLSARVIYEHRFSIKLRNVPPVSPAQVTPETYSPIF